MRGQPKPLPRHVWAAFVSTLLVLTGLSICDTAVADVGTVAHDALRTGWDSTESALSPSSVASSTFGKLFSTAVDGQVYAQPLVVDSTVIAATENNAVYGLDSTTGTAKWVRTLGPAWPASTVSCGDLTPSIGITSTPVFDPATKSVFLMAKTNDGSSPQLPHWYMHSLDPVTGAERAGFPVLIGGAPSNDPTHPFNAMTAMQRPGLLLMNGVVYAGFGGHCDYVPFVGYIVGVSTNGRQTTMWATESGNSNAEGGIWQSGGGLVSDGAGQIIVTTGNGISPAPGVGTTPPATLAESVVRLQVGGDGNLTPTDFFSPAANARLNQNDADLGSGAPVAIPDGYGTAQHPHLMAQVGKDGHVYLLDRDRLGGMAQGPGGTDAVLDEAGPYAGVWGRPAFLGTSGGGYLYDVENNGYLRAFKLMPNSAGGVTLASVATSPGTFGYTSGAPAVTSNGTDGSSALVWVVYVSGPTGANAELRAYSALPDSTGHLQQVFSSPLGVGSKFSSVATDGGRVFVGTRDGHVLAFGSPTTAAVGATGTDLGQVPVGAAQTGVVTITASRPVSISSVTASAPFQIGTSLTLPQTLAGGGSLAVPVTFSPSAAGQADGTLTVTTADGETDILGVHGVGTKDGLGSTPPALQYTSVPTQTISRRTVSIVNTGTTVVTITGITLPANAELSVDTGTAPVVGQQIQPLASVPVSLTFSPATANPVSDQLVVVSDYGAVTVPITATAISGAAHLQLPPTLDFGDIPVGTSTTRDFKILNTGNIPMTITKAKAPLGLFSTTAPIAEGLTIPAGGSAFQSVTFAPTAVGPAGTQNTFYLITADDGQGPLTVMLTGNGVDDPIAVKAQQVGAGQLQSNLGSALSLQYPVASGKCQDFVRGVVCWSPATGAHEVHGAVYTRYQAAGGAAGSLGFPTTDVMGTPDGVGQYTHFTGSGGSSIYWSPATGAHEVQGAIQAKWAALGWEQGRLGYPLTDELATADGAGRYNDFSGSGGASVYWSPATGAHEVHGAVYTRYQAAGGAAGSLGFPTTDVMGTPDGVGQYTHFTGSGGSSIYWSPATGAHEVQGAIRAKWAALGWEQGRLGYPLTDELATADGAGRYNDFSGSGGASVYWSPATGAHEVHGAVYTRYQAAGGAAGSLGFPTTDVMGTPDGVGQYTHFTGSGGSSIYWSPATGAHEVQGAIQAKWAALGWEQGRLGYPLTDELATADGAGRYNDFSGSGGASVYWSPATGAHEVHGAVYTRYQAAGGAAGSLGFPTTDVMGTPDGVGQYTHFTGSGGSSIYWSPATGAHEVQGAIRAKWAALGWEQGRLGYPLTDEYAVPLGRESDFGGGRLTWNSQTGTVSG
ncbi:choice-of-anchor D domain-containing protein [Arthrobacter sp. KNU40]|uniref:choice-of-anchor D domain-containing protein n=1 Tax=Arthrobacter sp. KNU40 TaxID=3447965 RepID=UPI003F5F855F